MLYALELRLRWFDPFGTVFFYDFGNVFSDWVPRFDKKLLQSWGFGLRYYSMLGPLSLDVGFPVNRRKGIDSAFQVYVNIGQAF